MGEDGILRRYRRFPDRHQYLGPVYKHRLEVQDLDISPFDECEYLTEITPEFHFTWTKKGKKCKIEM